MERIGCLQAVLKLTKSSSVEDLGTKMQAARGAVKEMREKGKSFVKPKYADQLLGSGLEEQIRRATAKTLPGPDLALNRQVGTATSCAARHRQRV